MATIMVALDGTVRAEQALPHARGRVQEAGDELLLVRVVEPGPPSRDAHHARQQLDQDFQEAEHYLGRLATLLRERGAQVRTLVVGGSAAEELSGAAEREQVNLIVMSSHGRTGPARWVLGSVAESTARRAPCPVWLVRCDESQGDLSEPWRVPPARPQRLLVPLDGTPEAERALGFVERLPVGEVVLVGATEHLTSGDLESYLDARGRTLWKKGWRVRAKVSEMFAAEAILEEMEAARPDLIVMATHGRQGLERWNLGSVAERVVRRAHCSVVLVPPVREGHDPRHRVVGAPGCTLPSASE